MVLEFDAYVVWENLLAVLLPFTGERQNKKSKGPVFL